MRMSRLAFLLLSALAPSAVLAQGAADAPYEQPPAAYPAQPPGAYPAPAQPAYPQAGAMAQPRPGHGRITREEWIQRAAEKAARNFDLMDTNHDGVLDPAERQAWRAAHPHGRPADAAPQPQAYAPQQ